MHYSIFINQGQYTLEGYGQTNNKTPPVKCNNKDNKSKIKL